MYSKIPMNIDCIPNNAEKNTLPDHQLNNHQLKLVGLNYGLKVRIRVD
jgi:hypothetical protein